jgi:hypothetical protein
MSPALWLAVHGVSLSEHLAQLARLEAAARELCETHEREQELCQRRPVVAVADADAPPWPMQLLPGAEVVDMATDGLLNTKESK